jgi:hypothetical protein
MILITKSDGGYTALATRPHVYKEWLSGEPMAAKALVAALLAQGVHQTDIGEAFYKAEPNWLKTIKP